MGRPSSAVHRTQTHYWHLPQFMNEFHRNSNFVCAFVIIVWSMQATQRCDASWSLAVCCRLWFLNCKLHSFRTFLLRRHIDINTISTMQFVKFLFAHEAGPVAGREMSLMSSCLREEIRVASRHLCISCSGSRVECTCSQPRLISIQTIARAPMHPLYTRTAHIQASTHSLAGAFRRSVICKGIPRALMFVRAEQLACRTVRNYTWTKFIASICINHYYFQSYA